MSRRGATPGRRRNAISSDELYDSKTGRRLIIRDGQRVVTPTYVRTEKGRGHSTEIDAHIHPFWSQGTSPDSSPEAARDRHELRLHPSVVAAVEEWRKTGAPDVKSSDYVTACDKMYQDMIQDKAMVETWDQKDEPKIPERKRNDPRWSCDTMSGAHFMDAILRWYARPPLDDDTASFLWTLYHKGAVPLPSPTVIR